MSILVVILALYSEIITTQTYLNKLVRSNFGYKDFQKYLSEEHYPLDYDEEVPECDYTTMTSKRFFNDYVKKNRPCLFKGYGKSQKAYQLWNNDTYLIEQAGDEIIYAER